MNEFLSKTKQATVLAVACLAATFGTVAVASPAQAAITCRVYAPSQRSDRSLDLLMYTSAPKNYAGKPVAWTVKTRWYDGITQTYDYKNYFISPTRHSYHTGPIAWGYKPYEVVAGFAGTMCAKWRKA